MSNTDRSPYTAPTVTDLGTVSEMTLTAISKTGTTGDTIVVNGQSVPVPGSSVV
jgi:hypothetical protein